MDGRISWFISPDLKQISCRCSGALAAPAWSSSSSLPLRFARTCRSFSVRDTSGHTTKQNALISRNTLAEKLCNINLPISKLYICCFSCHSAFFSRWLLGQPAHGLGSCLAGLGQKLCPSPAVEHRAVSHTACHVRFFSRQLVLKSDPSAVLIDVNLPLSVRLCQELKLWTYIFNIGGC